MLVSHRYKFIYTKTVKTGGTSVESYFERFCLPEGQWIQSHEHDEYVSTSGIIGHRGPNKPANCKFWNHMPATLIKEQLGNETWNEYFKFCVIRNPYDKVVSAYYFFQKANGKKNDAVNINKERKNFENWLLQGKQLPIDRDKYLINNEFCLDEVVRYENLLSDLEKINSRLGVQWEPSLLPTFKVGVRPKSAKTTDLYTETSKKIVQEAFAFEFDLFKYQFPNQSS